MSDSFCGIGNANGGHPVPGQKLPNAPKFLECTIGSTFRPRSEMETRATVSVPQIPRVQDDLSISRIRAIVQGRLQDAWRDTATESELLLIETPDD